MATKVTIVPKPDAIKQLIGAWDEGAGGLGEKPPPPPRSARWSPARAATDALAACMLVTMALDAWRLGVGGIVAPATRWGRVAAVLPWMAGR